MLIFGGMKITLICMIAGMLLSSPDTLVRRNSRAEVLSDVGRAGGVHYMYPSGQVRPTAPPKGYKPFYISHVGRHGARYALGATVYEDQWSVWSHARQKGWLTPAGETLYEAYAQLFPEVTRREGNLTQKGQEQHRQIARQMHGWFPAVFKGKTRAEASSTGVHRVIVSMFSYLDQLDDLDRNFDVVADYGYPYQRYLLPDVIDAPTVLPDSVQLKFRIFRDENLDCRAILGRWFTAADSLVADPYRFCSALHTIVSTLDNLDCDIPSALWTAFTPEERYRFWRVDNYSSYLRLGMSPEVENVRPEAMRALWADIVDRTARDWADGIALRLRFAHDSTLLPLLSLLDVNGMGARVSLPDDVEDYWRTFDIPMAANLQLVFFRSRRNPDILVQVLLNGQEAILPIPMAAPGSFYRWADIIQYYK